MNKQVVLICTVLLWLFALTSTTSTEAALFENEPIENTHWQSLRLVTFSENYNAKNFSWNKHTVTE